MKNHCVSEFMGNFKSFCHIHYATHTLNTTLTHEPDVLCFICNKVMGAQNPVQSIQMVCCSSGDWFHKSCLKERAYQQQDDFVCPKCADVDVFRENMQMNGVYIPKSAAVALYSSFNGSNETENEPQQKKRRISKDWIYEKTFSCKSDADKFLHDENWGYHYENKSENGLTITYRCKMMKFRGPQCAAAVQLVFDSRSTDIRLFRADNEHTHENHPNAVQSLTPEVQEAVKELYEHNITKPKTICTNLVKKGFELPPPAQLKTYLKKLNTEKFGESKIHCGTLEKWLEDCSSVPDSETQPFVMRYEMNYEDEKNVDFRFMVTTKLLLKHCMASDRLHVDATYKIIWQGFPVLVVGVTDMHRAFHPIGVAVCTTEAEKDFEFIFKSLKDSVREIFNAEFDPKFVIADAAHQIHNAARKVFGPNIQIIMCWFHMHKCVSDKVPSFLKELSKQNQFMADLDKLQVAKTPAIFEVALQLFLQKWRDEAEGLIDYFERQWVDQNRNWFESFAKRVPSTNNAMESNNRLIKDEHTLRERMDIGKFRFALFSMIETWSGAYVANQKVVHLEAPEIELKLCTDGYNFAKENLKITTRRRGNLIVYRTWLTDTIDDSTDFVDFDSFKKNSFSFYDTTFVYPVKRDNWLNSECDCCNYFKLFICKHILGIAIRLKCITPPAEAKTVPIGQKRKRGRPAKAKSALVRQ